MFSSTWNTLKKHANLLVEDQQAFEQQMQTRQKGAQKSRDETVSRDTDVESLD